MQELYKLKIKIMKVVLLSLLLLTSSLCLKLQVGAQLTLQQAYQLACAQAQGQVNYQASNLPAGIRLNGDRLQVYDAGKVTAGYYPIKIRAEDAYGQSDQRIVVIVLNDLGATSTVTLSGGSSSSVTVSTQSSQNTVFGSQGGVRTVSISSSTTGGNLRSAGLTAGGLGAFGAGGAGGAGVSQPLPQPDAGVGALLDGLNVPAGGAGGAGEAPGSGAPGSGAPGSGAPGSGAPGSGSGAPGSGSPSFPGDGSFPARRFPTGGSPNAAPNFTPTQIGSNQAPRSGATRNQITADDVKAQATFQRQLNAARALANLLSIVKQSTANKNAAQDQNVKRQDLYDAAIRNQRDAQNTVTKAESDVSRIKQGITQLTNNINTLKSKIAQINDQTREYTTQKQTITTGITSSQTQLNDITSQVNKAQRDLTDATDARDAKQKDCASYDYQIQTAINDKNAKTSEVSVIADKLGGAKDQAIADARKVNDLKAQLANAEAQLANSQRKVADLQNQQYTLGNIIQALGRRVEDIQSRKSRCSADINDLQIRITNIRDNVLAPLLDKKNKVESEIRALTTKVTEITTRIESRPGQLNDYTSQLATLDKNIAYLRQQLPIYERVLNDAYNAGNSRNDQVRAALQNLQAAANRFATEQKITDDATRNIQLARQEKQAADQAVNDLLKDSANILPFAAAPSAPAGTGVSGGAGAFPISSWNDYVRSVYGSAIKPIFVGDLNTLYPLRLPGQSGAPAAGAGGMPGAGGAGTMAGAGGQPGAGGMPGAGGAGTLAGALGGQPVAGTGGFDVMPGAGGAGTLAGAVGQPAPVALGLPSSGAVAIGGAQGGCGGNSADGLKAFSGHVVQVLPGSFRILGDGNSFEVTVGDCTLGLANKPNYNLSVGDIVLVKGVPNANRVQASHVSCIAQQ